MKESMVSTDILKRLRLSGVITSNEVLIQSGDLYVAEDVVTKQRRIIENVDSIINEGRRILKG